MSIGIGLEDWWIQEDRERRQAEIRALNHRLPGIRVVRDAEAIEALHRDLNAQEAWREQWHRLGVICAFFAGCALAWYGIIWLAYRATEGLR